MAYIRMGGGGGGSSQTYTKYTVVTKSTSTADASLYVKKYTVVGDVETLVFDRTVLYTSSATFIDDGVISVRFSSQSWYFQIKQPFYYNDIESQEQATTTLSWSYSIYKNYTVCVK